MVVDDIIQYTQEYCTTKFSFLLLEGTIENNYCIIKINKSNVDQMIENKTMNNIPFQIWQNAVRLTLISVLLKYLLNTKAKWLNR